MGKMEYLDALKRAMLGLPPEVQARTLAYYEQRFVDGEAGGRSERDVGVELEDPNQVALALRTSAHLDALKSLPAAAPAAPGAAFDGRPGAGKTFAVGGVRQPLRLLRVLVSSAGLAVFNLFMIVPAMVYATLLVALYVCALTFYLAGIATTASGLAGTNELVLDWPSRFIDVADDNGRPRQLRIDIGEHGINIHPERETAADSATDADVDAGPDDSRAAGRDAGDAEDAGQAGQADPEGGHRSRSRVLRGAEAVADGTVRISTGMDAGSRSVQTAVGFGMVLGGIALSLLALAVTRYTFVGLKRYLQMNWSLLRGNGA
jgi:uncharacterized membrane protein